MSSPRPGPLTPRQRSLAYSLAILLPALAVAGCASGATTDAGSELALLTAPPPEAACQPTAIAAAIAPGEVAFVDARNGCLIEMDELSSRVSNAQVVYVGESHDRPMHRQVQAAIADLLHQRAGRLSIGLEMLPASTQSTLDAFSQGDMQLADLPEAVKWKEHWGFPFDIYADLVRMGSRSGVELVALNVEAGITRQIARKGIDSLEPELRASLPETLDTSDEEYRAFILEAMMAHHGHGHSQAATTEKGAKDRPADPAGGESHGHGLHHGGKEIPSMEEVMENFVLAQVTWDETMAMNAAAKIVEDRDVPMLIAAGSGHIRYGWGIPSRVARRIPGIRGFSLVCLQRDAVSEDTVDPELADVVCITRESDE